jgi:hypothetical protein
VPGSWGNEIGSRAYRVEDPRVETVMLACGLVLLPLSFLAVWLTLRWCSPRYKPI